MIAEAMTVEIEAQGALLDRAIAGDEVAFARIVAAHHGAMARVAYLICGSFDIAEEAEQAAWAKVLAYCSVLSHGESFTRGVIELKDVVYFLSVIFFGLFLTARSIESLRWRA